VRNEADIRELRLPDLLVLSARKQTSRLAVGGVRVPGRRGVLRLGDEMTIQPCQWCHRKADCDIRRSKLVAVRGLKLTLIRFICKLPESDFQPGARVIARVLDRSDYKTLIPLPGTVMKHWRRGVLIAVDVDAKEKYVEGYTQPDDPEREMGDVISVQTERLSLLPGPGVRVCRQCGCPEDRGDLKRRDGQPWGVCEDCELLPAPVPFTTVDVEVKP
jgi:hypothetical protein